MSGNIKLSYKFWKHLEYPPSSAWMLGPYLKPLFAPQNTVPHVVLSSGAALLRMFFSFLVKIK